LMNTGRWIAESSCQFVIAGMIPDAIVNTTNATPMAKRI